MGVWKVYAKKADFSGIGEKYGIDPVLSRIIRNRDINEDQITMYLSKGEDSLQYLYDPNLLKGVKEAASILKEKAGSSKKIRIIGDYDIDGICSIYILYTALQRIGADTDYYIPHRIADGYGINENIIRQAKDDGIDTIITCDNGIAAIEQIKYAKTLGMTVIVTDHHDIPFDEINGKRVYLESEADAIIDPKQTHCRYPYKQLCGAGVAYKLVQVLFEACGICAAETDELIELTAVATIGDIVELKDENRIFVKEGLQRIVNTNHKGLRALIQACGIEGKISAYHIGFVIGPCLNASGRLDTAQRALELLLERDMKKALILANDLKALNDERKTMTSEQTELALKFIEETGLHKDNILVVYLPDCHESLAGIIAGRIREKYYKPAIVLTDAQEGVKGSARSIEAYDMFEALSRCKQLLTKFGGHKMAAGLSIAKENVEILREKLNQEANLTKEDLTLVVWIDVPMPVDYVTADLIRQLSILEPYGKGNEKPVFADKNLLVRKVSMLGKNHNMVKIVLENERKYVIDAIMFHITDQKIPKEGDTVSMLYYPDINEYQGRESIQFKVLEFRVS